MKLEARDTPKASILEAYREDGIRAQCVEVTVKGGKLQKYTLSYGAFRDMHGIVLEPGHAVKMEKLAGDRPAGVEGKGAGGEAQGGPGDSESTQCAERAIQGEGG